MNLENLTKAQKTAINMALTTGKFTHDKGRYNVHIFKTISQALVKKNVLTEENTLTQEALQELTPKKTIKVTKIQLMQQMMASEYGASVSEISAELGWQHHTIRAAITRLRKAQKIETLKNAGNSTRYKIVK